MKSHHKIKSFEYLLLSCPSVLKQTDRFFIQFNLYVKVFDFVRESVQFSSMMLHKNLYKFIIDVVGGGGNIRGLSMSKPP